MKKVLFLVLVFLINSNLFSQTGWVEVNTGFQRIIIDVYFVNPNTGWAVGDSIIIKSTNGGLNWTRQNYAYINNMRTTLNTVRFINENTGYVGGGHYSGFYDFYYQYIFKTTDSGNSWNLLYHIQGSAGSVIFKIYPVNQNHIYVSHIGSAYNAASGGVMKSSNGGTNFQFGFSKGECNALYALDSNTAWVSFYYWTDVPAMKGYIYKTTNGGLNWIEQFKDSLYNSSKIKSICFVNQNTGYAVGQIFSGSTRFFKTTNGGTNWDTIRSNNIKNNSVFFINASIGWTGGHWLSDSACIAYTTNGGVNWSLQKKGTPYIVTNLNFANSLTGWATLENNSSILRTTTGGFTFVNNISSEVPDKYSLSQNYPNPFNPYTNISYKVKRHEVIKLSVYDVGGKEVAVLVNEKQSPGTYEVKFEAGDLPSGVYFYKLTAGDYSETKKMILLK